jgi:nicotinamidase-related amidase
MAILAVVDMQPGFHAAQHCLPNVIDLVKKAVVRKIPIVIIELSPSFNKPTYPEIIELVKDYPLLVQTNKNGDDGSKEIKSALESSLVDAKLDKIRVCGVNSNACVRATALGLADIYKRSQVILHYEACCGTSGTMHNDLTNSDWDWFRYRTEENLLICKSGLLYNSKHEIARAA